MSVEDWAREQGAYMTGYDSPEREPFAGGIVRAFDALLSDDKAARAAVRQLTEFGCNTPAKFRAALQAAIAAVTEGDTK